MYGMLKLNYNIASIEAMIYQDKDENFLKTINRFFNFDTTSLPNICDTECQNYIGTSLMMMKKACKLR